MSAQEVPLAGSPKALRVVINGTTYTLRTYWVSAEDGGWFLDMGDETGAPIACGLSMVPGVDLLGQFGYLAIGGAGCRLYVYSDGDAKRPPGFGDLGVTSHLVFTSGS